MHPSSSPLEREVHADKPDTRDLILSKRAGLCRLRMRELSMERQRGALALIEVVSHRNGVRLHIPEFLVECRISLEIIPDPVESVIGDGRDDEVVVDLHKSSVPSRRLRVQDSLRPKEIGRVVGDHVGPEYIHLGQRG